jgi:hypothetical protein
MVKMSGKMAKRWAEWRKSLDKCKHVFNMSKQPETEFLVCEKCGWKVKKGWLYDEKEDEK